MPITLEIAAGSVDDALAAQTGGAQRIELNSALALGGLTPSAGLLTEVKQVISLPVMVMIRPRPSGFRYSDADFLVMRRDLNLALESGADGVVFGVLTEGGDIDTRRCRELVRDCGTAPAVFHRAFDLTPDPFAALEQLVDCGVRRVMTSGQQETAHNGAGTIAEMIRRARGRIDILPAGGINRSNVAEVIARTGCDQVHCGLRTPRADPSTRFRPSITFGSSTTRDDQYDVVDPAAVAEMRKLI